MANGVSTSQKSERFAHHPESIALPRGLLILMLAVMGWAAIITVSIGVGQALAFLLQLR